jgi:hypothetical protein
MATRPPADAVVALRSLGRRFRGLFAGREHDESPDDLAHRVGPDGQSANHHIAAAGRSIAFLGRALEQILVEDDPVLHPGVVDHDARVYAEAPDGPVEDRLAELESAAEQLAARADRVSAADWGRTGRVASMDASVSAAAVLWDAVDTAVEHLRTAERTLDAVRRRG